MTSETNQAVLNNRHNYHFRNDTTILTPSKRSTMPIGKYSNTKLNERPKLPDCIEKALLSQCGPNSKLNARQIINQ